jgi:hypothetical protein
MTGGQGCPRSEWRDLIENAEFAELQAFFDHQVSSRNGEKGHEGKQERWAQFFRDLNCFVATAHSRNRLDLDGRLSVGTTADARTRLGIPRQRKDTRPPWNCFRRCSPGEVDHRWNKPTHKVKHFCICASWANYGGGMKSVQIFIL